MKYPLLLVPFTSALLLTACGGNSTGGDIPPPAPTPTPTPTPTPPPPPPPPATAAGLWQFPANASKRGIAALVAQANGSMVSNYWLVYSNVNQSMVPVGFVAGTATSVPGAGSPSGTFNSATSVELREFKFDGSADTPAQGSLNTTFTERTSLGGSFLSAALSLPPIYKYSPAGSQTAADNPPATTTYTNCDLNSTTSCLNPVSAVGPNFSFGTTEWSIDTTTPALSGTFVFDPFSAHVDALSGALVADIFNPRNILTVSGTPTYDSLTRTLSIASASFSNAGSSPSSCVGAKLICGNVPTDPITGDISLTFDDNTLTTFTGVAHTNQNTTGGTSTSTLTFHSVGVPHTNPGSTITQNFTSTYNNAYETAAALSTVEGSHTGTAGVGVNMQAATFVVTSGVVSGSESGGCSYAGTLTPNTTNNYFAVSLTFSGGGCAYAASGTFTGSAFIDTNNQLNVTAVNAARDLGFLFVGP